MEGKEVMKELDVHTRATTIDLSTIKNGQDGSILRPGKQQKTPHF